MLIMLGKKYISVNKYSLCIVVLAFTFTTACFGQTDPKNLNIQWKTDTEKTVVPIAQFIVMQEPGENPPIYYPEYVETGKAGKAYFKAEPVIVVEYKGEAKAYPLSVLLFHEIVHDEIHGMPYVVTYDPYTNASAVYLRRMNFANTEYNLSFSSSGMIRQGALVLYDRNTESWWQQITGEALVGKLAGAKLEEYPTQVVSLAEFQESYPNGSILSNKIQSRKKFKYGTTPLVKFDTPLDKKPKYFEDSIDARMPAMEKLVVINTGENIIAFPWSRISRQHVISYQEDTLSLVVFYSGKAVSVCDEKEIEMSAKTGSATVFSTAVEGVHLTFRKEGDYFFDNQSGSKWSITGKCLEGKHSALSLNRLQAENPYAYAWLHFYPETRILKK